MRVNIFHISLRVLTSVVTKTQTQIHIKQMEMSQSFLMNFCFGHQDEMKGDTCLLSQLKGSARSAF